MTAYDNERKVLDHVKLNQINVQEQLKDQYSVTYKIIKQLNETTKSMEHNEQESKAKILQL